MRFKTLYLTVAVALFFGLLFNLPSPLADGFKSMLRDIMAPHQALTAAIRSHVRQRIDARHKRRNLEVKLTALETEIKTLRSQSLRLDVLSDENAALRRQLRYSPASAPMDMVACRVIARGDITGWWRTLRINRGEADGIAPPMAVVSEDGLVGRVLQTSRHTADVLLISDASSRVSTRVLPSGTPGILEGPAPHLGRKDMIPHLLLPVPSFPLDYLDLQSDVSPGHQVVTSGLGSLFPAGLLVGVIVAVRTDKSGLYRRAEVRPAADFTRLDALFVIRRPESETAP